MARKRYGEGSLYHDDRRDLWTGTVEIGVDPTTGRRVRRRVTGRTKAATVAKMRAVQVDKDKGLPVASSGTVAQWLTLWVDTIVPRTVAPATAVSYEVAVRCHLIPHLGKHRLRQLTPEHVEAMMAALEGQGMAPGTVRRIRIILRRALSDAERRGKAARNVAALSVAPRASATRLDDALDADDASTVLAAASGDRLGALAVIVLAVGLRRGEAIALRWPDVDLSAGTVTVVKAKTASGVRTIALPAFAVAALRDRRRVQRSERMAAASWEDNGLVFTRPDGRPVTGSMAYHWWRALTDAAGIDRCRFHATRHSAATLMLNNGVPLEVVSKTLGHAGLAITADTYAKVRPELQRSAADAMQGVLGGPVGG